MACVVMIDALLIAVRLRQAIPHKESNGYNVHAKAQSFLSSHWILISYFAVSPAPYTKCMVPGYKAVKNETPQFMYCMQSKNNQLR